MFETNQQYLLSLNPQAGKVSVEAQLFFLCSLPLQMGKLRLENLVSNKRKSEFSERLSLKDRPLQQDGHIREIDKDFTIKEKQSFLSWGEGGAGGISRGSWTMEGTGSVRMDRKLSPLWWPEKADKDTFLSCVLAQGWDPKTCGQRETPC